MKTKKEVTPIVKGSVVAKVTTNNTIKTDDFPIVAIGASAGGLEALEQFFANMPKDNGMAFVVIQHLDPTHVGMMPELLQRFTTMKVCQATDRLKVKSNSVYVIPPNKSMQILNRTLYLFDPIEMRGLRLPIDIFFRSLADDREEKSIGIILSGMGSDGSLGVKAIKEKNGMVLVQTPSIAKFDGMPHSAVQAVVADIIASADELPSKLIAFLKYNPVIINKEGEIDSHSLSNLEKIILLLREQTGNDFSLYKKNTIMRRIERRKGIHQIDKLQNYVRFCQGNPAEVKILFKEMLIGVTSFFRDDDVWETLKEKILPAFIEQFTDGHTIRAWVVACSTGEEAYSLAILFYEMMERMKNRKSLTLQIFATDIDSDAIEIARRGVFSSNLVSCISQDRLNRFFTLESDNYRVNTAIREMIVFAPQNIIKDPPFTKLDMLFCRNMLIYMEPELQKKIISLFNYSLKPEGIMILGTAETLGKNNFGFEETNHKLKIYKRSSTFTANDLINFPSSFSRVKNETSPIEPPSKVVDNIQIVTDQILLQRFAPASVLVNEKGDIIYITGKTGKYLEPVAGKANWNIYSMAREGLQHELPGAFRKVSQSTEPVVLHNIKIGTNGGTQFVDVTVQRILNPEAIKGMIIVVFTDVPAVIKNETISTSVVKRSSKGKLKELELELQRSYENLQSTKEEMQTSQEELKSTNEELQSTNEELQSTNEELTTSKEEMQSLNEELQTVNAELQSKVNDFVQANNDMKNLLNSTEIATLFLDKELNIRRYTDSAINIIKLRQTDIGRPFTDLVSDLQYPQIGNDALNVIKTLMTIETVIATTDGRWFTVRIMPYRTLDDHINGLVITFNDITIAVKAKEELSISETRYRRLFETSQDGMLILDAVTGKIMDVNPYLIKMLGYSQEQFLEKAIWEIGTFKDIVANKDKFHELQQNEFVRYENLPLETADARKINVEFVSNVYLVGNLKVVQCQIREKI